MPPKVKNTAYTTFVRNTVVPDAQIDLFEGDEKSLLTARRAIKRIFSEHGIDLEEDDFAIRDRLTPDGHDLLLVTNVPIVITSEKNIFSERIIPEPFWSGTIIDLKNPYVWIPPFLNKTYNVSQCPFIAEGADGEDRLVLSIAKKRVNPLEAMRVEDHELLTEPSGQVSFPERVAKVEQKDDEIEFLGRSEIPGRTEILPQFEILPPSERENYNVELIETSMKGIRFFTSPETPNLRIFKLGGEIFFANEHRLDARKVLSGNENLWQVYQRCGGKNFDPEEKIFYFQIYDSEMYATWYKFAYPALSLLGIYDITHSSMSGTSIAPFWINPPEVNIDQVNEYLDLPVEERLKDFHDLVSHGGKYLGGISLFFYNPNSDDTFVKIIPLGESWRKMVLGEDGSKPTGFLRQAINLTGVRFMTPAEFSKRNLAIGTDIPTNPIGRMECALEALQYVTPPIVPQGFPPTGDYILFEFVWGEDGVIDRWCQWEEERQRKPGSKLSASEKKVWGDYIKSGMPSFKEFVKQLDIPANGYYVNAIDLSGLIASGPFKLALKHDPIRYRSTVPVVTETGSDILEEVTSGIDAVTL